MSTSHDQGSCEQGKDISNLQKYGASKSNKSKNHKHNGKNLEMHQQSPEF
jgi:hypothetical protein